MFQQEFYLITEAAQNCSTNMLQIFSISILDTLPSFTTCSSFSNFSTLSVAEKFMMSLTSLKECFKINFSLEYSLFSFLHKSLQSHLQDPSSLATLMATDSISSNGLFVLLLLQLLFQFHYSPNFYLIRFSKFHKKTKTKICMKTIEIIKKKKN